ncbi:MAG: hypothetical protein ABSD44_02270 [Terracidiphilus sp.]
MAPVPRFWGPGDGSYSGSATTPQSIASALATAIQAGGSVTAKSDGDVNVLVSTSTGSATDYNVTASTAYDTMDFTAPSFTATAFSMGDGLAGDASGAQIDSYYVPSGGYAANTGVPDDRSSSAGWKRQPAGRVRLGDGRLALTTRSCHSWNGLCCWRGWGGVGVRRLEHFRFAS